MSLKHVYCVPKAFAESEEREEVLQLLTRISQTLSIPFEDRTLHDEAEESRIKMTMLPIAVSARLRVHKSAKGKSLYPHLLVYNGSDPIAFFPQIRKEGNRKLEIRIPEYLSSLLGGSLKSLVPIPALEEKVPRKEVVDKQTLREGYATTAREIRRIMAEWSSVESPWPE